MRALAAPALQDADASAVRQAEAANIKGIRRRVFTAPRLFPMVDITAGEAAEMIDLAQIAGHQLTGQRLRLLFDVQRAAERQRAAGEKLLLSCTEPKLATRTTLRSGQAPSLSATGWLAMSRRRLASASREAHWSAVRLRNLNDVSQPGDRQGPAAPADSGVAADSDIPRARAEQPGQHQQRLSSHARSRQLIR